MSLDSLIDAFDEAEGSDLERRLSDSSGSSDDLIPSDEEDQSGRGDSDFDPSELADSKRGLGTPRPSVTEITDILSHLHTTSMEDSDAESGAEEPTAAGVESARKRKELATASTAVTSTESALESKKRRKGERFARFYINEFMCYQRLGKGAFGHVVLAKNLYNEQKVAIKIITKSLLKKKKVFKERGQPPGDMLENIFREIAILKRLAHPHTVKLWQVIDDAKVDRLYMVFDYLNGGELVEIPHRLKPHICTALTDLDQIRSYICDIALGLDYLHQNGVIHADVKPENVMVTRDLLKSGALLPSSSAMKKDSDHHTPAATATISGDTSEGRGRRGSLTMEQDEEDDSKQSWDDTRHLKYGRCVLVDFGVSFVLSDEQMYEKNGFVAIAKGTPAFLAPECDEEEFSAYAMDVWAFGLTVYMMSVGVCVFAADSVHATFERIQTLDPDYPESLDSRLVDLCRMMLMKDPLKRIKLDELPSHPFITDNGRLPVLKQPDWVLSDMGRSTHSTDISGVKKSSATVTRRRSSIRDVITAQEISEAITTVKPPSTDV